MSHVFKLKYIYIQREGTDVGVRARGEINFFIYFSSFRFFLRFTEIGL